MKYKTIKDDSLAEKYGKRTTEQDKRRPKTKIITNLSLISLVSLIGKLKKG